MRKLITGGVLVLASAVLGACGNYSTEPAFGSGSSGGAVGSGSTGSDKFFTSQVQPRLAFCRNCHIPGGVADTDAGRRMMLSSDSSQDSAKLKGSWQAMDGNNPVSRILLTASGQVAHSGGAPWPQGGDAYQAVAALLACFEKPAECGSLVAGGPAPEVLPLLGPSVHGGSFADAFCEGRDGLSPRPDSTLVPSDPRTRLTQGYDNGTRAVYFNGAFQDCQAGMPADQQPLGFKTCGEYRERVARTEAFILAQMLGTPKTAAEHDSEWQDWGISARPANYEALYALEHQTTVSAFHNPYPLEGEDPNAPGVNGGSGQLPVDMRQLKDADGKWTGMVAKQIGSCSGCHMTQVGSYGEPGAAGGWGSGTNVNGALGGQRGQSDAHTAFEALYFVVGDWDTVTPNPLPGKYIGNKATNRSDTPSWWNVGHRARKFFDGGNSVMGTRIDLSGAAVGPLLQGGLVEWIEQWDQDMQTYVERVKSPPWPQAQSPVDTTLAAQGAILFHTKDLWAQPANAARPKPLGGNGSCASCHGAYSPRFVNDPTYLESPDFEGIANHISPPEVIGTDTARLDTLNIEFTDVWDTSWWAYPDHQPGFVAPADKTPAQEAADDNKALIAAGLRTVGACDWGPPNGVPLVGWLAPPLYGVWASAPYFHNGSVPTVEAVLDSTQRQNIWRRKLLDTPSGAKTFDHSFATGYDFAAMGWKTDEISCAAFGNDPLYSCNPSAGQDPPLTRQAVNLFESNFVGGVGTVVAGSPFQLAPVPGQETDAGLDTKLIHDTRIHSNANTGHEFTDALTDKERKAILEYLKTL